MSSMTLEERIQMATSGWLDTAEFVGDAAFARDSIEKLVRKAAYMLFPELFAASPTHWLAPMEPTAEMYKAAGTTLSHFEGDYGDYNVYFDDHQTDKLYLAVRDAYLKGQS